MRKMVISDKINRRKFLMSSATFAVASSTSFVVSARAKSTGEKFEIMRTEKQWKKILTPNQFKILRQEATETKYSSPLLAEKRLGSFNCAGCDLPVYHSTTKYDSKTGWPSFYNAISGAIRAKDDNTFFSTRKEVHCRRCGGHFGHIFNDGPASTGKRHCLNGLALIFRPVFS